MSTGLEIKGDFAVLTNQEEIWPNFFIVGAQKAGTTSLYFYLKKIPQVYMSPLKETFYFAPNAVQSKSSDVIRDKKEYLKLFQNARGHVAVGEATPIYLWDPDAPRLIHQTVPHARIIIILRDPIERAYSNYLMKMKYSGMKSSFYDDLIRDYNSKEKLFGRSQLYVEFGMYYEQVKRYLDIFGQEQVKVIISEEFIRHPEQTVNEVLAFLGVNYTVTAIREQYNPYSVPRGPLALWIFGFFRWLRARNIKFYKILTVLPDSLVESLPENLLFKRVQKPKIDPKAVKFLQEIYYDEVIRLGSLLGRSLPWHTVLGSSNNNKRMT
jgi:Sulfotransferase domain